MSTIIAADKSGNIVQFEVDGHPVETDAQTTALQALIAAAGATSINSAGSLTVGAALAVTTTSTFTGAVDCDSTFNADGASTFGSTLGITGATTAAAITSSGLVTAATAKLDTGTKTATATAGAATLNKASGIVTSEALTTAAGATYTLTLTNSTIAAGDIPQVTLDSNGSAGIPIITSAKCTANTLTVIVTNIHASAALNAAIKFAYMILKA